MPAPSRLAFVAVVALLLHAGPAAAQHPMDGASSATAQALAASVHRTLGCGSCHGEHAPPGAAGQACLACHASAAADFNDGSHGTALRRAAPNAPTCVSCHGGHGVKPAREAGAPTSAREQPASCGSCHKTAGAEFISGVHGPALLQPTSTTAPTCTTCHGRHLASTSSTPRSTVHRTTVPSTCGACHVSALLQFRRSVHGSGVARNVAHAPTCVTCHGSHAIFEPNAGYAPTSALRVSGETCARCHASVLVTEMHDLPVKVVEDFRGSYHGIVGARGDRRAANCASCHGAHEIRPSTNPFSRTHPANLAQTCGGCHPGATGAFARGGVHHVQKTFGHRLIDIVGGMYGGMIVLVIGMMVVHNALDFQRRWRDHGTRAIPVEEAEYLRFTVNERVQHWVLAASFVTLAASGFALRFGWPLPLLGAEAEESLRAAIHRASALVFSGLALYHVGYLALTARGQHIARSILPRVRSATDAVCCAAACARLGPPTRSDWSEMLATLRYNVGLAGERPRYGRFAYWEKMEYWALVWGAFVMISTGVVLWFEVPVLNRLPYWAFELSRTIHFYEATLAVLAIVVWHFYYVIVNPDVFPLSRAMTRGTLTASQMRHEHRLELEADVGSRRRTPEGPNGAA